MADTRCENGQLFSIDLFFITMSFQTFTFLNKVHSMLMDRRRHRSILKSGCQSHSSDLHSKISKEFYLVEEGIIDGIEKRIGNRNHSTLNIHQNSWLKVTQKHCDWGSSTHPTGGSRTIP